MLSKIKSVILCGGSGSRLWPFSRESSPKQFAPLIDGKSLLSLTINRVKKFGIPICVTNEEYRFFVQNLLKQEFSTSDFFRPTILLEPAGRNTAAAMASASFMPGIKQTDLLLFLPSDHYIPNVDNFSEIIQSGISAAQAGYIVTYGIQPTIPSTAYGYIELGSSLNFLNAFTTTYTVGRFIEKPLITDAQKMLLSGNYLWNAGIFLCKASVLTEAMSIHAPDILKSCQIAMQNSITDGDFVRPNFESFISCRSDSIDYAVMEHFKKMAVVPFKGAWSDLGSWNAVAALTPEDQSGNRISGHGMAFQSNNTYINAPYRPVISLGTSDLVIVDTPDAILVASADKVEHVKDVVVALKKAGQSEAETHRKVLRPWGWYDSIDKGERFQVKRISVNPGAKLSLQMHHHRAEHWIVVKGTAKVTNGDHIFLLEENQSTYIPIGVKHRLENPGTTDLEMIEVQSGSYLGEDDIVRFEDTYGRS